MTALLEAKQLRKTFGGLVATNDLSFHVKDGETLGLIGPNGAGKTTIFNLLTNELPLDSGEITLDGQVINALPVHKRVQRGLVRTYQVPRPFAEMTVLENIRVSMMPDALWPMISQPADRETEIQLASSVGFRSDQLQRYPSELAMGDLRKLELARSLATQPRILLLDEVFAGLTYGEIEQISSLILERKKQGMTFMIVSHDLKALAPLVDRVMVLSFGQTIAEGSFEEVIGNKQVQDAYLGSSVSKSVAGTAPGDQS